MNNVEMKLVGTKLVLEIDLTKDIGPSRTGKTTVIGTTNGNVRVPGYDGVQFGLSVFKYPER